MTTTTTTKSKLKYFFFVHSIIFIFISRAYELFIDRSFSSISSFEKVLQKKNKVEKSSSTHLIIELYFKKIEAFRVDYVKMREILQLIAKVFHNNDDNSIDDLSLKLNSLKKHVRRYIFMFKLLRKTLSIVIKKQSSLTIKKKSKKKRIKRLT